MRLGRSRAMQGCVNILEGLTKTRHPAAKAVTQAPAKQEVAKKRSCSAGKPARMRASEGENASLRKDASILASLRNGPTKKQRPAEGPRALPLVAMAKPLCLHAARLVLSKQSSPIGGWFVHCN